MSKQTNKEPSRVRRFIAVIMIGLLLYAVLPQLSVFRASLPAVRHTDMTWFLFAIAAGLSTYLAAASIYTAIAFKPLRFGTTTLVQVASMFVNRLLPAGVGALGASYLYLRHEKHAPAQAAAVITLNNTLGIVGHALLLLTALIFYPRSLHLTMPRHTLLAIVLALTFFGIVGVILFRLKRAKIRHKIGEFMQQVAAYRLRPGCLVIGLCFSMLLTAGNVLCVYFCLRAIGVSLSIPSILIAYSAGVWLGTTIPTPGGLGGVEAGLAAGLVAYHVSSASAVAAVILFRVITYWMGLALGAPAFFVANRSHLFATKY